MEWNGRSITKVLGVNADYDIFLEILAGNKFIASIRRQVNANCVHVHPVWHQ